MPSAWDVCFVALHRHKEALAGCAQHLHFHDSTMQKYNKSNNKETLFKKLVAKVPGSTFQDPESQVQVQGPRVACNDVM